MPQPSTLKYVADLVIERVFAEFQPGDDLAQMLRNAYPFGNSVVGRRIWIDALFRHAADRRIDFAVQSFNSEENVMETTTTPSEAPIVIYRHRSVHLK